MKGRLKARLGRAASGVVCAAIAASCFTSAVPGMAAENSGNYDDIKSEYFVRGDADADYTVGGADALAIQKHLAQVETVEGQKLMSADANADGRVDISDVVYVMMWMSNGDKSCFAGDYVLKDYSDDPVYFAVDSELYHAVKESTNEGFTGTAYVNFDNEQGSSAAFKVNAEMPGVYKLRIKYANGTDINRQMYVSVNGSSKAVLADFPGTGSWTDWEESVIAVVLEEGENEIKFISAVEDGGPNVDCFSICGYTGAASVTVDMPEMPVVPDETTTTTTDPDIRPVNKRYYAVDAEYYKGVSETVNEGFAGEAYVNYDNVTGSYVNWTVDVPEDGNYRIYFRYANGTDADRVTKLTVNGGKKCCYMSFNSTGAWTSWETNSVVLELKAGTNTIKAVATTENGGPNMDYIELEKTDDPAAELVESTDGRQVENLSRGVSAAYTGKGVMVSWRILATDSENTIFKLYKNGQTPPIYEGTINEASCYLDAEGTASDWYTIDTYEGDTMTEFAQLAISLPNKNSGQSGAYFDIPLDKPDDMTMPDGTTCSYTPNDASVGDVDGDGDYEIILKWNPSNAQDNSKDGYTGNVYIDCYEMDGTRLWRIDLGKNIRAGAHYTQFMVYDYDGDGKAEMVVKTADGTVDGTGKTIGDASADYRSTAGRILTGPEYLTLFEGATGKALDTIDYKPGRGTVSSWGDNYGNRVDRFIAATAYLDGKTPSVVMIRGYYTRMAATAYDVVDNKLVERWAFDTGHNSAVAGYGDGNHNAMAADLDGDGKDEIVVGSAVLDDDGTLLYTSGLGHGDAMHIGDFDPSNPGLEIFMCHEEEESGYGVSLRDGETGEMLFRETGDSDTGRCLADNLIAGNDTAEIVGSHNSVVYDTSGNVVCNWSDITKWGQNSVVYWTDTLERCVLDRTMVDQYGKGRVFTGDGVTYNNDSKSNASLTCDLFGDWREEMIFPTSDGTALRVFGTTYTTEYPIYTLMHNTQYREQVSDQNVAYNQPPHTDYFLGTGYDLPEVPEVYVAK